MDCGGNFKPKGKKMYTKNGNNYAIFHGSALKIFTQSNNINTKP